jgi:hypothetical protein
MAKGLNLKAIFSSDTKGLKKGSKEAAESIKAFENESSGALTSLAGAMGINVDQLQRMSKAGEGAGRLLSSVFKTAGTEAGALAGTIGGLVGGIGALVVGSAVASWKELNEQADYFYNNSTQGSIALAGLTAYTDTVKNTIRELNNPEGAAEMTSIWKKKWSNAMAYVRSAWLQTGNALFGVEDEDTSTAGIFAKTIIQAKAAIYNAHNAEETAKQLKAAQIEFARVQANELANMKEQYEEERLMARDMNLSYEERLGHQRRAGELLREMSALEDEHRGKIVDLTNLYNTYTMTSEDAELAALQLQREQTMARASYKSQQKEIGEYEKTLTNEIKKGNDELEKRVALATSQAVSADLDALTFDIEIPFDELTAESSAFTAQLTDDLNKFMSNVNMDLLDVEAARAIDAAKAVATQINDSFKGIINNAVSGISDLVGQAIAGTTNFGQGLLALLGDLITQLGEIAIAAGVGMLSIKKAFESLNPWVAIAAGVALVALGSAISNSVASLSNNIGAATGGYSVGGSSQDYASMLNRAPSSDPVEVTGRFEIRGDDLVAVIGRNQKRKSYVG